MDRIRGITVIVAIALAFGAGAVVGPSILGTATAEKSGHTDEAMLHDNRQAHQHSVAMNGDHHAHCEGMMEGMGHEAMHQQCHAMMEDMDHDAMHRMCRGMMGDTDNGMMGGGMMDGMMPGTPNMMRGMMGR